MMYLRSILVKAASKFMQHGWRLKSPVMLLLALVLSLAQVQFGVAAIVNDAVAVATYGGTPVTSNQSSQSIDVEAGDIAYQMTAVAVLDDQDGDGLGDAGETINYTYTFRNTGNITLTNLQLSEALSGISAITCSPDGDADGDIDSLAPLATATCTASYPITLADLSQNTIDTVATPQATSTDGVSVVVEDNAANDNTTTTPLDRLNQLQLRKQATAPLMVFPNIYQYDYTIEVENSGTITQSNIVLSDDLGAAVTSPASMVSASIVSMTNFTGTGTLNGSFDGVGNNLLFSGDVQLAPGEIGQVRLRIRVNTVGEPFLSLNTAYVASSSITTPIPSDDPSETPGDPNDINPATVFILDSDRDGVNNGEESDSADADGDAIPDIDDYDPTGYLYCETGGRILTGGLISVQNLATSGTQFGVGTSNNITIVRDGSDGQYQFHVDRAGTYRLRVADLPTGAPPLSTTRLPGSTLDATSLLPNNPAVLGSYISGSPEALIDDSAGANPYYFDIQIDEFDPVIFNNNIPFALCGDPEITATKTVVSGPSLQADGSNVVTYRLNAENTGTLYARDVQITDTLVAVYGTGNYAINSVTLDSAPATFGAAINPAYDGDTNLNLLTVGGQLNAGETVSILVAIEVNVAAGSYTNEMIVNATNPVSGGAVDPSSAQVSVSILGLSGQQLVVTKTTRLVDVKLGQAVPYSITVQNTQSFARNDVEIIDQMPAGFTYVPNSATLDGVAVEPTNSGRELVWSGFNIPANSTRVLQIVLRVGAAVNARKFTNKAFVRRRDNRELISNIAKAVVNLSIEPVFNCSDIIGRVFNDLNGNGYFDEGEEGLSGVRVATVNGLLITTDSFGRFHVACAAIPDGQIGSNFIMKLDARTLPSGFSLTSENPRVVRLTQGKLTKINFGAAKLREVQLGLDDRSFGEGSNRLTPKALGRVAQLLPILEEKPSLLKLTYSAGKDRRSLIRQRLRAVKSLIEAAWRAGKQPYNLVVKTKIQK